MKKTFCSTLLLVFTLGSAAQAQTIAANDFFRPLASQIPDKIIQSCGIKNIGKLDLTRLSTVAKSTDWRVLTDNFASDQQGKGRLWAVYDQDTQIIFVNQLTVQSQLANPYLKSTLPTLALHEALRKFGGADEDYQTSIALGVISETCDTSPFSKDLALIKEGGVTSTGGGGDDAGILVKTVLLQLILKNETYANISLRAPKIKNWDRQELKKKILSLQIENADVIPGDIEAKATYNDTTKTYELPKLIFMTKSADLINALVLDVLLQVVNNETR